jgi:tRNA A-37 threonylcarbamoyl transferase component Bud32
MTPRILVITDQTSFARALEHHVSIVWEDVECRVHEPSRSGRLHSGFSAIGYDAVLLDDQVEGGLGAEWLENLLHRSHFPPVIYFNSADVPRRRAGERDAFERVSRVKIDHRKLATALRDAVQRRRQELALLRTGPELEAQSHFGPIMIRGHRFVRELAVGGTSMVYLAESERAGEMVVLKVLRDEAERGDNHVQFSRFLQEYELISRIRHANVVRIHDLGIADDHAFIAMEYFPRGDLRAFIQRGMRPAEALDYLEQMATALRVVHAVGVLHRDLKPGNVMMRTDGSIALIDFGLAKHFEMPTDITATGEIFGTPYYMSPEQGHGQPLDERSDLYSLGVIFYEMLTGKKPFVGPSPMAVIYMHGNAPRPRLEGGLAGYQEILDRLLAMDPADRFASASALLARIQEMKTEAVA